MKFICCSFGWQQILKQLKHLIPPVQFCSKYFWSKRIEKVSIFRMLLSTQKWNCQLLTEVKQEISVGLNGDTQKLHRDKLVRTETVDWSAGEICVICVLQFKGTITVSRCLWAGHTVPAHHLMAHAFERDCTDKHQQAPQWMSFSQSRWALWGRRVRMNGNVWHFYILCKWWQQIKLHFFSFYVESFQEAHRCHVTSNGDKSRWFLFYKILFFFRLAWYTRSLERKNIL